MVCDFEGGSKYLKIYIPHTEVPDFLLCDTLNNIEDIWNAEAEVDIKSGLAGAEESISKSDLKFTGRVIVWTPTEIEYDRWAHVGNQIAGNGLSLIVRDAKYVKVRDMYETPLAFISHDSRDKPIFVQELAAKLTSALCPVWYDEYSLKPGDSLRASIEAGLKACPRCIVVLSKNFFDNPGWVRREFDMIYTREVVHGQRIMLPIWLGVSKKQVYDYSPILADTVGINADIGIEEVARRLMGVLNYVPPSRPVGE